jgi:hypothetical protein
MPDIEAIYLIAGIILEVGNGYQKDTPADLLAMWVFRQE